MVTDIKAVKMNRTLSLAFDDDLSKAVADMKDNMSSEIYIFSTKQPRSSATGLSPYKAGFHGFFLKFI